MDMNHLQTITDWRGNKETIECLSVLALRHIGFHENPRLSEQTGGNLKERGDRALYAPGC